MCVTSFPSLSEAAAKEPADTKLERSESQGRAWLSLIDFSSALSNLRVSSRSRGG
jgi:hypothetical protein